MESTLPIVNVSDIVSTDFVGSKVYKAVNPEIFNLYILGYPVDEFIFTNSSYWNTDDLYLSVWLDNYQLELLISENSNNVYLMDHSGNHQDLNDKLLGTGKVSSVAEVPGLLENSDGYTSIAFTPEYKNEVLNVIKEAMTMYDLDKSESDF